MDFTWTVPVALILGATAYAIVARYLVHRERLARAGSTVVGTPQPRE
jgi:hypothetical protein